MIENKEKERPYAFREELLTIHEPNLRDWNRREDANSFCIRDGMSISMEQGAGTISRIAAEDLQDFLLISMGVHTELVDTGASDVQLFFAGEDILKECNDYRGFVIETTASGIRIGGHDERGIALGIYYFEDLMRFRKMPSISFGLIRKKPMFSRMMVHSGYGEMDYPDPYLCRLAHEGRDVILLSVKGINQTEAGKLDFNDLICRAEKYGIDVYAYSELESNMSPEAPDAEAYYDATYGELFRLCPGFKGLILVGEAVEFPSRDPHVASGKYYELVQDGIPSIKVSSGWYPCEDYPLWVNMVKHAVQKYCPEADIVFWTYNWGYQPEAARIQLIENLPEDLSLEVTFEMFERINYPNSVGITADYTLAVEGPGKYFVSEAEAAKKRGLRLYAMANTGGLTWDFGSIPYEPMPYQWIKRYQQLQIAHDRWGLSGLMETHEYGFYPSFVSKLSMHCFLEPREDMSVLLRTILCSEFGEENYEKVDYAMQLFSEAICYYTPSNSDQYGAFRVGPSYPFWLFHTAKIPCDEGYSVMDAICFPTYYSLIDSRESPPSLRVPDEMHSLDTMLLFLDGGIATLSAIEKPNRKICKLTNLGKYLANCVRTGIHAKKWFLLKNQLNAGNNPTQLLQILDEMESLLLKEKQNVKNTIPLVERDSRLGWEVSMLYTSDRRHLEWKLRQIKYVIEKELGDCRKSIQMHLREVSTE